MSLGTVSNVLNRPERVSPPTRDRVLQAIESLSFVPSGPARQLRAGTLTAVGAVLLDISNPFFTEVARGIEDRLGDDDLTLMIASSDSDPGRESRCLRQFEEHGVLGVLVTPATENIDHLRDLRNRGVGVVLLDRRSTHPDLSSVAVDDVKGGRMAVEHLLDLGHRRIGLINGPASIQQCADRREGAMRALDSAGISRDALLEVVVRELSVAGGEYGADAILADRDRPTALFCANDITAMGAIRRIRTSGLGVPEDIAVVGYDDVSFAAMMTTPLTSIRQPTRQLGTVAADLLLRGIASAEMPAQQIEFEPELVVRESSGPPR